MILVQGWFRRRSVPAGRPFVRVCDCLCVSVCMGLWRHPCAPFKWYMGALCTIRCNMQHRGAMYTTVHKGNYIFFNQGALIISLRVEKTFWNLYYHCLHDYLLSGICATRDNSQVQPEYIGRNRWNCPWVCPSREWASVNRTRNFRPILAPLSLFWAILGLFWPLFGPFWANLDL